MSKFKKQDLIMWQNILPDLKKTIQQLFNEHQAKPIKTLPPDNFAAKLNAIKTTLELGEIHQEDYFDVFAFLIEERTNITLFDLGDQMVENFGKTRDYWQDKILRWAHLSSMSSSLTTWNVTDFMRNHVNYQTSPIERHNIYQWRLKAQSYISSIQFLIKKITSPKLPEASAYSLDDAYMKYYKAKMVFSTFLESQDGFYQNTQENDERSITHQFKKKAEMKLFNFGGHNGSVRVEYNFESLEGRNTKKGVNTLEKYFVKSGSQDGSNEEEVNDEEQKAQKQREFVNVLRNVGSNDEKYCMDELRREQVVNKEREKQRRVREQQQRSEGMMRSTKRMTNMIKYTENINSNNNNSISNSININNNNNNNKNENNSQSVINLSEGHQRLVIKQRQHFQCMQLKQYPISHFTHIFDQRDYFQYVGYRMAQRQDIILRNPFILYPWVNYYITDQEEYNQHFAIDLDNDDAMLSDSDQSAEFEDNQDGQGNSNYDDNSFIDHRNVITNYIDAHPLTAQDLIQFKNHIHQNDQRWVANFIHTNNKQTKNLLLQPQQPVNHQTQSQSHKYQKQLKQNQKELKQDQKQLKQDQKSNPNHKISKKSHSNPLSQPQETSYHSSPYRDLGLQVIPVYGGQFPFPIDPPQTKTKRRNINSKSKFDTLSNASSNHSNNVHYEITEIIENSEDDNSTSNQNHSHSRMLNFNLDHIQTINEVKIEKQEQDDHGEETTFDDRSYQIVILPQKILCKEETKYQDNYKHQNQEKEEKEETDIEI